MDVNLYLDLKHILDQEYKEMDNNRLNYPFNFSEGYLAALDLFEQKLDKMYENSNKINVND